MDKFMKEISGFLMSAMIGQRIKDKLKGSIRNCCLLVLSLLIYGCSDGGGGNSDNEGGEELLVGVLVGVGEGVYFSTESLSGFTDSDGSFNYKTGENVEFSVGSVELGSSIAKSQVTLFDLFSMEPPLTEKSFRSELQNEEITDFDKVANLAYFLVALDVDRNPYNGVSLIGRHEILSDVSIDFDKDLYEFPDSGYPGSLFEVGFTAGINFRSVDITEPLTYFYDAMEIKFPVKMLTGYEEYNSLESNTPLVKSEFAYDDYGRSIKWKESGPGLGRAVNYYEYTYSYDIAGRLSSYEKERSEILSGVTTIMQDKASVKYDDKANIIQYLYERNINRESGPSSSHKEDYSYGSSGEILQISKQIKGFHDQQTYSDYVPEFDIRYSYDTYGEPIFKETSSFDALAVWLDRRLVSISRKNYTYFPDRSLNSFSNKLFWIEETGTERLRDGYDYVYDEVGRELNYDEFELSSDGEISRSLTRVSQYDSDGNRAYSEDFFSKFIDKKYQINGNEVLDHFGRVVSDTYEYKQDSDLDGVWDNSYVGLKEFGYDDYGSQTYDRRSIDGVVTEEVTYNYTYDSDGLLLTKTETNRGRLNQVQFTSVFRGDGTIMYLYDNDTNADGIIDTHGSLTYTFDEVGNLLSREYEGRESDSPDDKWGSKIIRSYTTSNDTAGIYYLINLFRERAAYNRSTRWYFSELCPACSYYQAVE
ncbi:hypothetical protein ACJJIR_02150 [Microbulbifer sp. SSSA008]|uniref:hypothetical protein n=1 Tax=Microbulbifer sp. SSSA008 TaxID=3243380 RepID=UPI0040395126